MYYLSLLSVSRVISRITMFRHFTIFVPDSQKQNKAVILILKNILPMIYPTIIFLEINK